MSKRRKKFLGITILILFIAIGSTIYCISVDYQRALEKPNSESEEVVAFEIEHGEPIESVIDRLIQKDLLRDRYRNYFLLHLRKNDIISEMQAGSFNIPSNLNIRQLAYTLQNAQKPSKWVNIPTGLRKDEVAKILDERFENIQKEDFINISKNSSFIESMELPIENIDTLEGFLYPDKYLLEKEIQTKHAVKEMVQNFKDKIDKEYTYEDIILASIVEKEAKSLEDREKIASILRKRLDEQWLLQTDSTLLYQKNDWEHEITVEDKEESHAFNTYKYHGLPPQPICNPSIESINKTLNPVNTDYYYYFEDYSGKIRYAETFEEHEKNLEIYQ